MSSRAWAVVLALLLILAVLSPFLLIKLAGWPSDVSPTDRTPAAQRP